MDTESCLTYVQGVFDTLNDFDIDSVSRLEALLGASYEVVAGWLTLSVDLSGAVAMDLLRGLLGDNIWTNRPRHRTLGVFEFEQYFLDSKTAMDLPGYADALTKAEAAFEKHGTCPGRMPDGFDCADYCVGQELICWFNHFRLSEVEDD